MDDVRGKKKGKKKKIILAILIVLLICVIGLIAFGVFKFASNIKEDQAITTKKINEISEKYNEFNSSIQAFAALREEIYTSKEEIYLEEISNNTDYWNTLIDKYAASIKDVEAKAKDLKDDCKIRFADVGTNGRCTNFKANYEAAMNYYITDVKVYNKMVKEYNDWVGTSSKYSKLEEAKLVVYDDYIDYDGDGDKFGKEEVE